jgi:hypothetical protein
VMDYLVVDLIDKADTIYDQINSDRLKLIKWSKNNIVKVQIKVTQQPWPTRRSQILI